MKKMSIIYLSAISIALFGCVKGPVAELEEKGLKPLTSDQRLEAFCNGSFENTYEWGKSSMEVNDCNYVWTNLGNGEVYEGTLIESPEGEGCTLRKKAKGKVIDPPRKSCSKSVTFKTGDNEWKTFKEGKLDVTVVKK